MKLRFDLENFLNEARFKLDVQKAGRARLLRAVEKPTRISVGGKEYPVRDGVVDVPQEVAGVLLAQGWRKLGDDARTSGSTNKDAEKSA